MFTDFEYASELLSDYKCMICSFNGANQDTVSAGSVLTWNTVKAPKSNKWKIYSATYEEAYSTEFQFCKNPCVDNNPLFSLEEITAIQRWLNRKQNYKFKVVQEGYENVYWKGSFNVQVIKGQGGVIGFDVTFTSNASYAFMDELEYNWESEVNEEFVICDYSKEVGYIYPSTLRITCLADGNLTIKNSIENRTTSIGNCLNGEVITFDGENQIITTSKEAHKIYNDFNYNFFRIANTYEDNINRITSSIPCKIELVYSPIVKVGV